MPGMLFLVSVLIHPFQGNATLHLYPHFKALQDIEGKIIFIVTG